MKQLPTSTQPSLTVGTVILDEVLAVIASALTSHVPERGGLLFGPRGQKLITLFVADENADHHYGTYTPSAEICASSPEIERNHGLEYKGLIHSHPGSMDHPSGPDIKNARRALGTNPHLSYFMMPIVTLGEFKASELGSHELILPGGKLSHWIVPQSVSTEARQLCEERVTALTLWSDLRKLAALLPGQPEVARSSMLDIEGVSAAAYLLHSEQGIWMFAAAAGYPFTPPLVVPPAGDRSAVALAWDLNITAEQRFHAAVAPLLADHVALASETIAEVEKKAAKRAKKRRRAKKELQAVCLLLLFSSAIGSYIGGIAAQSQSLKIQHTASAPMIPPPGNTTDSKPSEKVHALADETPKTFPSGEELLASDNQNHPAGDIPLMDFYNHHHAPLENLDGIIWKFHTSDFLKPYTRP